MIEAKAGSPQLLVDTEGYIEVTLYVDGTATDATSPPTVTITRADGTAVVTAQASTDSGVGVYRFALTKAQLASLDILTAVWTGTVGGDDFDFTTTHEVVGGFYCTLAEIRALQSLGDAAKFPAAKLIEARQFVESTIEDYCGVAFVPRYATETLDGAGRTWLDLEHLYPRSLRSVTETDSAGTVTTYDADDLADIALDPSGRITRRTLGTFAATYAVGAANITVAYEHWAYAAPPADLKRAALQAIRYTLLGDNSPLAGSRVRTVNNEIGQIAFSKADPFGPEDVDRVVQRHSQRVPVVA